MKKILQSIVLVLLLLAISSNLLASSYSRTASGSWDDWGWSADWIIPGNSFPIVQALTLIYGGRAAGRGMINAYRSFRELWEEVWVRELTLLRLGKFGEYLNKILGYAPIDDYSITWVFSGTVEKKPSPLKHLWISQWAC